MDDDFYAWSDTFLKIFQGLRYFSEDSLWRAVDVQFLTIDFLHLLDILSNHKHRRYYKMLPWLMVQLKSPQNNVIQNQVKKNILWFVEQVDEALPQRRSNGWRYLGPHGNTYQHQAAFDI